jgi:hypothetical protein
MGVPNQGPKSGSHMTLRVCSRAPAACSSVHLEKMQKCPNVQIEGVKVGQSYFKAYGTTCRRQKAM